VHASQLVEPAQASQLVEPAQASSPHFIIAIPDANVGNPSSSDTEELLDLLFPSPARDPRSPALRLCMSSDSDSLEDWPKANDMAASVYVVMSVDASSSRALVADSSRGGRQCV
jgi:hypothetical protein